MGKTKGLPKLAFTATRSMITSSFSVLLSSVGCPHSSSISLYIYSLLASSSQTLINAKQDSSFEGEHTSLRGTLSPHGTFELIFNRAEETILL